MASTSSPSSSAFCLLRPAASAHSSGSSRASERHISSDRVTSCFSHRFTSAACRASCHHNLRQQHPALSSEIGRTFGSGIGQTEGRGLKSSGSCSLRRRDKVHEQRRGRLRVVAAQGSSGAQETSRKPLHEIVVFKLDGSELPLVDLWREGRAVVGWARHFGCLLCRKRAALMAALKPELDAAGVRLVLIGPGNIEQARVFAEETKFPGEVYADPTYDSFRNFDFIYGIETTVTLGAARNLIKARLEGFLQNWELSKYPDTMERGGWQQGGILVAGPGIDNVLFLHKDKEAGDEPDMKDVLKACCTVAAK